MSRNRWRCWSASPGHTQPSPQRPGPGSTHWEPQLGEIQARFEALNPYDQAAVAGSIPTIEDVNFNPETARQREIEAYVISAKRDALFTQRPDGTPEVLRDGYSEHGLGHLLNPMDPELEDRNWIRATWQGLARHEALSRKRKRFCADGRKVDRWPGNSQAPAGAYTMYGARP